MCNALLPALESSNRLTSERGGDASFKILLAEDSASSQGNLARAPSSNETKSRIPLLCTPADVVNQKVALKFLESAGHQTEVVENGALALEAVKKNFYDVGACPSPKARQRMADLRSSFDRLS